MARSGKLKMPTSGGSGSELDARFTESAGRFMEEVRRILRRRRMSGAELARTMGISRAAVSRILGPGANPTLRSMVALAGALDREIKVVFHRTQLKIGFPPGLKPWMNPPKTRL